MIMEIFVFCVYLVVAFNKARNIPDKSLFSIFDWLWARGKKSWLTSRLFRMRERIIIDVR